MDVSNLMIGEIGAMHVKNAAGTLLYHGNNPCRILFYGPATHQFAQLEAKQNARAVQRHNDNEGKLVARSPEDRRREAAEDLADITHSIENLSDGGKTGRELFLSLYGNPKLGFLIEQSNKFIGNWGNFPAASPTS